MCSCLPVPPEGQGGEPWPSRSPGRPPEGASVSAAAGLRPAPSVLWVWVGLPLKGESTHSTEMVPFPQAI